MGRRCNVTHDTRTLGDGFVSQCTATCETCGKTWMEPTPEAAEQCLLDMCEALDEVESEGSKAIRKHAALFKRLKEMGD